MPATLRLSVFALALAVGTASAAADAFRAQGNEPSWSLRKTADAITFDTLGGTAVTIAPVPEPVTANGRAVYTASVEDEAFVLTIGDEVCTDTMSGMPFPRTVTVELGADAYAGCGGEPAALLAGDWRIASVAGKPPVAGSEPSLAFDVETRMVSGSASCNRFFGAFTLTGEGLSFGEMGSGMMMCEDAVMAQERTVLDILAGTTNFSIGAEGGLTLHAADGREIVAAR